MCDKRSVKKEIRARIKSKEISAARCAFVCLGLVLLPVCVAVIAGEFVIGEVRACAVDFGLKVEMITGI